MGVSVCCLRVSLGVEVLMVRSLVEDSYGHVQLWGHLERVLTALLRTLCCFLCGMYAPLTCPVCVCMCLCTVLCVICTCLCTVLSCVVYVCASVLSCVLYVRASVLSCVCMYVPLYMCMATVCNLVLAVSSCDVLHSLLMYVMCTYMCVRSS